MKALIIIGAFLLVGCIPSVYDLSKSQMQDVSIELNMGNKIDVKLSNADEDNLYFLRDTIITNPDLYNIKTKQKVLMSIPKEEIRSIHDRFGNDLTAQYLERNLNDRSVRRLADIQTRYYNAYLGYTLFTCAVLLLTLMFVK